MFKLFRTCFLILFIISTTSVAYAESTWISKKSDKSKKVEKVEKTENSTWIKKKKENKKKFKKKKKEIKSWITKKSKNEIKEEKKKLKEYLDIDNLPKAEFYFVAEGSNGEFFYGYVNSSKDSEKIKINNVTYNNKSDGFGFLDDGKTTCKVNSKLALVFNNLGGQVLVECIDGTEFNGIYVQQGKIGYGTGVTNKGDDINFKFFSTKVEALAQYENLKDKNIMIAGGTSPTNNPKFIDIKPLGKYYALLIGNSKYDNWASLTSPKNDINELYKVLKSNYNFEKIIKVNDASRSKIFRAFKELRNITSDKDYILIYYSGHGQRDSNQAFWIPREADKDCGSGNCINTSDIHVQIAKIKAQHILLLNDSCFVGTAFKGNNDEILQKSSEEIEVRQIVKYLNQRARRLISSGGNSQVIDEAVKGHSLFAYKLIDLLKKNKNYLTSMQIFYEIEKYHALMDNQTPIIGTVATWGHLNGHFVFLPKK